MKLLGNGSIKKSRCAFTSRNGDATLQTGNSEAIIRNHYLDLKSVEDADDFWSIVPMGQTLPELEKKDGRYVPTS